MARVKRGTFAKKRHNKILKQAKGFHLGRKNIFRLANQALLKSKQNQFKGRKNKKRDFRKLWIIRINAGLKTYNITYSKFINLLNKKNIELNRKILAQLATEYPAEFDKVVKKVI